MITRTVCIFLLLCGIAVSGYAADNAPESDAATSESTLSWAKLIDSVKKDESMAAFRDKLIDDAKKAAEQPIVKRAKTLAEVGQNRTWLDGRANALEPEIKETFALAMSDMAACGALAGELPLLAAAVRLTGDAKLRTRVVDQLEEAADWSPIQRPGWTLYHPGARLPEGGKDGNWLATGLGVRAIADTLDLMPKGSVSEGLKKKLSMLLETEIASIVDDWNTKRPWFVSGNNPITNQWVLPTEGLVRACLVLGADKHKDAYELGVTNLLKALDAHGPAGEFEEGIGYASFTVTSMLHAARAMSVAGDRRGIDHPFLKNFPTWFVHHFQPADMYINCFDAGPARGAAERSRPLLSMLAVCTGSPVARWALANLTIGPSEDLAGLAARALPPVGKDAAPPLFAAYERATRVNWRNNWNLVGSGFWLRGGHPLDQHDHCDRGHLNFIAGGKPILIEAGTPHYSHPLMGSHFASGVGHNVLQIGTLEAASANAGETVQLKGWQPMGVVAPITVKTLDIEGGQASVTVSTGYDGLKRWVREAFWDALHVSVQDSVELLDGRSEVIMFRWHLGTDEDVVIEQDDETCKVSWSDAEITFESPAAYTVTQVKLPDNTINTVSENWQSDPRHTCLVVQTNDASPAFSILTEVSAR